jgi:hypothetical protein
MVAERGSKPPVTSKQIDGQTKRTITKGEKMNINDFTIGQAKELASLFGTSTPAFDSSKQDHGIQIVILDRGFVYIGRVTADAEWIHIKDASNLRVWGTSKGLGELVDGPLANTKLDKTGNVKASRKALIAMIAVSEESWTKKL